MTVPRCETMPDWAYDTCPYCEGLGYLPRFNGDLIGVYRPTYDERVEFRILYLKPSDPGYTLRTLFADGSGSPVPASEVRKKIMDGWWVRVGDPPVESKE